MLCRQVFWKRCFSFAALACAALCLARPAAAQIGGADLPDLSGLAGAIEKSTAAPPAKKAAPAGIYHSGLAVPSVHPGETSKSIVRQMREPIEKKSGPNAALQKLEDGMPALLTQLEAYLPKQGLAKRDLGVAFGVFFVKNWETANHLTLSDPTEIKLIQAVGDSAAAKYKVKFAAMTPAAKEKTYEQVLMSTILISTLTEAFDKAGKTADAAGFRKAAASVFTALVGTAPDMIDISPDGKVTGPPPAPPVSGGILPPGGDDPAPIAPAPPTDTPAQPAPDAPMEPGKPGARALPPGGGIKPAQIAGVYAAQVIRVGVGGGMTMPFVPILALKDGTYLEDFDVPPSDLNLAASRRSSPSEWGRWRFNAAVGSGERQWKGAAKHIQIQGKKGAWQTADWIGPLLGAAPDERLSGVCKTSGGGGSTASGFSYGYDEAYTFFPDGRYQFGKNSGFSSSSYDVTTVETTRTLQPQRGTYTIGNYVLTLRASDGTVKRLAFARTPDGLVFLDGAAYTINNP